MGRSRLARAISVSALLASCLEPDLKLCGSVVCSPDQRCIVDGQCATSDAITACDGLAEGTACQSATATGRCVNTACVANVCGDGAATGTEVCDGSDVPVTCVELGYYTGTPRCTQGCALDRTGCSGRCGDGLVQRDQGELCDGTPPVETCGDFGRDFGTLDCNRFCSPDIANGCHSYAWEVVLPAQPGLSETVVAMNRHGAVGVYDAVVRVIWDGVQSTRPNSGGWTFADADATTFLVASATTSSWFDGTAWHDLAVGVTGTVGDVVQAGELYELDLDCTFRSIDLATGMVRSLPAAPDSTCQQFVRSSGELVALTTSDLVAFDGAQWRTVGVNVAPGTTLYPANGGRVWAFLGQRNVNLIDLATGEQRASRLSSPQQLYPDGDGDVYVINSSPGGTSFDMVIGGALIAAPITPPGVWPSRTSAEGAVVASGAGVYRLAPVARPAITGAGAVDQLYALPDGSGSGSGSGSGANIGTGDGAPAIEYGAIAVCGSLVGYFSGSTGGAFVWVHTPNECRALIGDPRGDYLFADNNGVWSSALADYELLGFEYTVTGTPADAWAGGYYGGSVEHRSLGAWTDVPLPAGTALGFLAGGGGLPLHVVTHSVGGDALYRYDPPSWTHLLDLAIPASGLAVAPDGALFVSSDVTARLDGATLTPIAPASPRIIAQGAEDIYVDLRTGVFDHYSHGRISTLHMPTGPLAVVPNAYYGFDTSAFAIEVIARMPTVFGSAAP
jgi:hypothetical protein